MVISGFDRAERNRFNALRPQPKSGWGDKDGNILSPSPSGNAGKAGNAGKSTGGFGGSAGKIGGTFGGFGNSTGTESVKKRSAGLKKYKAAYQGKVK